METLRYVVLVNGLLAVVSLAYYVLLRRETYFGANRLALWAGLTCAFILPLLELPDWRPQPVRRAMQRTAQAIVPRVLPKPQLPSADVTITFPNKKTYKAFHIEQEGFIWSWQIGLIALYVVIAFLLLIRFTIQLASLRKLIRQSVHEAYNDFTLVQNGRVTSPFSFFGWVVVNPDQHTPDELDQILRHERVHVRERHSLDMIGAELICILFWFNPAVYLFRHLVHQVLEFNADRAVLAEGVDPITYQYNLLKVSLSSGQSSITNHFSRPQLKYRIAMLNQQKSSKASWLKYPVLFIAALTIASAFARPKHVNELGRYVSQPLIKTIAAVAEPTREPLLTNQEAEQLVPFESTLQENNKDNVSKTPIQESNQQQNSVKPDTVRVSPSRYMVYQGDYLYWIVTPKTTFDDFAIMKREFEKHGNLMQLNEVKYDPLYAYIDRISFTVKRQWGGMTNCEETDNDNKPIPAIAGYVGIGPKANASSTGGLRYYRTEFPEALRTVAAEEERTTDQFISAHKIDYLMLEGEQKFKNLGNGARSYAKSYMQKNPTQNNSGLIVNADGTLSVKEDLGNIKLFVNNESIERTALNEIKVDRLYSVVEKLQYNPARKESFTSALLIYITEAR
ncbi:M56 family metallopeptidase [Spirosoma validum]|uniref:M56 family metallopeptidase n=1 Tax=Spirosoma validum TaxID=2771355 RepID=A0A927B6V5_9BACT|nr:M56 family metallopeptidase [Spirosoma validum]MBD2756252.1 M56 family metallopeptidase [Spirosoma validum]